MWGRTRWIRAIRFFLHSKEKSDGPIIAFSLTGTKTAGHPAVTTVMIADIDDFAEWGNVR